MKHRHRIILFLAFSCFLFSSCSNDKTTHSQNTMKLEGENCVFLVNGKEVAREIFKNGNLQTIGIIPDGTWKVYYENGNTNLEGNYKNGKKDGVWKIFYEDGKIWSEESYKDGRPHGLWKLYHKTGLLEREESYKDGKPHGLWKDYTAWGLAREVNYEEGQKHGIYRDYFFGKLANEGSYKTGKKDGEWKSYSVKDGRLVESVIYKDGITLKKEEQ